jgi:hypothetical protein
MLNRLNKDELIFNLPLPTQRKNELETGRSKSFISNKTGQQSGKKKAGP